MTIINRYISKEIILSLLGVTLILLLTFLSQQLVRYLGYVANGKIPGSMLVNLVLFEIPYLLALLLPLGLYLGMILTYSRLYADNEMAILKISGFKRTNLRLLSCLISGGIAVIILILMLWVNPWISAKRQTLLSSDEATLHLIRTILPGRFQVSPDGRHVMYVEKLSRDHKKAQKVFLAQEKKSSIDDGSWDLVLAEEGYQLKNKTTKENFFISKDGYKYEGIPGQKDYKIIQFNKYILRIPDTEPRIHDQENEALPTIKLLQDYQNQKKAAEFQWRVSFAIVALVLSLYAIPFSTVQPRNSRFIMLFPAVLVYIFYFNLLIVAKRWIEQSQLSITYGLWWVHLLMLTLLLLIMLISKRISLS